MPMPTISWLEGFDLLRREPCWVPAEIVHTDYTQPLDGYFLAGSNGLASGNHLVEAIIAAICELVERDAVALWSASGIRARAQRALDLASIDDPDCRALLAKYAEAGIAVRLWNVTTDIGIPAFLCDIRDPSGGEPRRLRRFHGAGCHPDRAIALARALTEAAQTRLTYIAGIRDDLLPSEYEEPPNAEIADALLDALRRRASPHSFREVPSFAADDLGQDLALGAGALAVGGDRAGRRRRSDPPGIRDSGRPGGDPGARRRHQAPGLPSRTAGAASRGAMRDEAVIFAGPSLPPALRPADPALEWRPPVRQGDVYGPRSPARRSSASSTAISR